MLRLVVAYAVLLIATVIAATVSVTLASGWTDTQPAAGVITAGCPFGVPDPTGDIDGDTLTNGEEAALGTHPCRADTDGDGFQDLPTVDNCPINYNPGQEDSDSAIDNGPSLPGDDLTLPNSDALGDACDPDDDNDGLADADESPLAACGAFNGILPGHPSPAGGDNTNDDNGNGNPAPPMGSDAADNGPSWDTDNDGYLDGAECALGFNPRDPASKPTPSLCGGVGDADGDGLTIAAETCKWGTSDTQLDSDGDGLKDCVEANDTNGDNFQNFPGDTINSAKVANNIIGKTMDFDLNGDGVVNFPGDTILSAKMANHVGGICP